MMEGDFRGLPALMERPRKESGGPARCEGPPDVLVPGVVYCVAVSVASSYTTLPPTIVSTDLRLWMSSAGTVR